ncbi:hypothetical protein [Psychrobacillus psychrotolerans]|uniref:hypothetical protein n=1 Tax=Psychrobacillus psychrotolerans TaxID=126156 RepID=UPI003C792F62
MLSNLETDNHKNKRNDYETENLKLASRFIKGEINFEKYFNERGITPKVKLNEVKYLLNDNPMIFNLYLAELTIGVRCLVMKTVFDLDDRKLDELTDTYNSKTSIRNFIKSNFTHESKDRTIKRSKNSIELADEVAIILDLPFRFLAKRNIKYKITDSFDEYDNDFIQIISFKKLIEEVTSNTKRMLGEQRKIFGVKLVVDEFLLEEGPLNTRVDIRANYFTIEIHIKNEASLKYSNILKLQSLIKGKSEIFIRDAFLRSNKKLILLVPTNNSAIPDISYLDKKFQADNLFSLDNILSKGKEDS